MFLGKISHSTFIDQNLSCKFIPSSYQICSLKEALLNFGKESFRSNAQLDFFINVIFTKTNIFAVQPTGSGKSLAFLLHAKIFPSCLVVVVVPLLSLIDDLVRRSELARITVVKSLDDVTPNTSIVFLTPESFIKDSTVKQIHELSELGKLTKVFIDECHFAVIDKDFRTSYSRLASICKSLRSVVLLTGSASLCTEEELKRLFFEDNSIVKIR